MQLTLLMDAVWKVVERRRAEEALRESEEKYRLIVDNTADTITVMDLDLQYTYVSPSIYNLRGYTVEEAMIQTLEQTMTPDSLKRAYDIFAEEIALEASGTADPNRSRTLELEEYCRDGSTIWVENSLSFIRDKANKPVGILAVSKDITERKKAEEAVKQSREWYRTLAEDIPALVTRISPDSRFTYVNDAYCRFIGSEREDIIGKDLYQFVPPENNLQVKKSLASLAPEKDIVTHEHTNRAYDGSLRWIRWTNRALYDSDGTLKEYLCIGEDITEQRQVEEALRKNEARNRALVSTIPDMLFRYNREGIYLDAEVKDHSLLSYQGQRLYKTSRSSR